MTSLAPIRRIYVAMEYPDCENNRALLESAVRYRRSPDTWLRWYCTFGGTSKAQAFFRALDGEWSVIDETYSRRTFPPCSFTTFHDLLWNTRDSRMWKRVAYDPWLARGKRLVSIDRQAGRLPQGLRQRVFDRDDARCRWCGTTSALNVDHIIPRRFGGLNDEENCQILCHRCNQIKRTIDEWHFGTLGSAYRRQLMRRQSRLALMESPFKAVNSFAPAI